MWRDDRIQVAIDTTTGFIAAKLAEKLNCPIYEMERLFLASKTYRLLCDLEMGLYADNVLETADLFLREEAPVFFPHDKSTAHSYFKYRSLTVPCNKEIADACKREIVDPYTKAIFEKRELWYSAPKDFNDPFDCNLPLNCDGLTDKEIEDFNIGIAKKQGRRLSSDELKRATDTVKSGQTNPLLVKWRKDCYVDSSVCCFSHLGDSIQMFSYYADSHKGICIEFSFSVLDMPTGISVAQQLFGSPRIVPIDVVYKKKFPELNFLKLFAFDPKKMVKTLLGTKAINWKHEKEFRIFRPQMPAGAIPFAPQILKRVILGAKTDDDKMALVKGWLKEWPTPVILSKAEADAKSFTLNIRDVETVGGAPNLKDAPSIRR